MKWLFFLSILGSLGYGALWTLQKNPAIKLSLHELIPASEFHTLEVRYSAEQIMESHRSELLKSGRHKYLETETKFYPYLLMEVKYSISAKKTEESLILWDLSDGEMVLNTKGWEKTHGFGDCLTANTTRKEFSIIRWLAKKGGTADRESLIEALHIENETLDVLLEGLKRKQLIVLSGNRYRLHLQSPNLKATPVTQMHERLVTKMGKKAKKAPKRFSLAQVERLTKAAFGEDFAIRHTKDVYLPVHSIVVQNPDGSLHTSLWNALNGKRIISSYGTD